MIDSQAEHKIQQMLESEFDAAKQNIIVRNEDGSYNVFMLFDLQPKDGSVQVYKNQDLVATFSSLRAAFSWCIAEKYQQYHLANNIQILDRDLVRLDQNNAVLRHQVSHTRDQQQRFVIRNKHEQNLSRLSHAQQQMIKCVNRAKYLQIRGFNDEIARTRRPTPTRTSRPAARKPNR